MSGRTRVRAYHSMSPVRPGLISATDMFFDHDDTLSTKPVMVTFGCAETGPAIAINAMTTRKRIPTLLITASSCGCENDHDPECTTSRHNTNTCGQQYDVVSFTGKPSVRARKNRLSVPPNPAAERPLPLRDQPAAEG